LGLTGLVCAAFASLRPSLVPSSPSSRLGLAIAAALACLVPALRPAGGPLRIGRYSVSDDGIRWREPPLPVSLDPGRTLWLRATIQAPTDVREVVLEAGDACVMEARVNKVLRLRNERCPAPDAGRRFSATSYLVPGPNLVELELRAASVPALVRELRFEAP
jgi:hypothetical protein